MKTINVLAAFIGGVVAGAAAGILLAPQKGEDTRAKIAESLKEAGVKLNKEDFEKLVKDLSSKLTRKKSVVEEVIEEEV